MPHYVHFLHFKYPLLSHHVVARVVSCRGISLAAVTRVWLSPALRPRLSGVVPAVVMTSPGSVSHYPYAVVGRPSAAGCPSVARPPATVPSALSSSELVHPAVVEADKLAAFPSLSAHPYPDLSCPSRPPQCASLTARALVESSHEFRVLTAFLQCSRPSDVVHSLLGKWDEVHCRSLQAIIAAGPGAGRG